MKKRSFLSILLVFVMIATVCLFVGCDEEGTNAKIDDAVVEAVAQATEKIETAKAELTAAIAAKADPATLTAKAEELNAAIDAAKAAGTNVIDNVLYVKCGKIPFLGKVTDEEKATAVKWAEDIIAALK